MTDPTALLVLLAAVAFWWWHRGTRYVPPDAPGDRLDVAHLREMDIALVRCEHPDHHPETVPFAPVRYRYAREDVRQLSLDGWGATERMNACRVHNTAGWAGPLHVQCSRPGCQTHHVIPVDDPEVGIGDLRNRGWCNLGDRLVCPYCAGTRSRVWR